MLFKLSNLNSNVALTLGYLNPALDNSADSTVMCEVTGRDSPRTPALSQTSRKQRGKRKRPADNLRTRLAFTMIITNLPSSLLPSHQPRLPPRKLREDD